ncbi:hypothetical protein QUF75_16355 [Desulfococcaceae bacterium HSG7]|nr:hypothetical protein [Desulfococcaceae bacterium HSG7]
MKRFLTIAQRYTALIIDLCVEEDVISRPKLLNYMERYRIEPGKKDGVIRELCGASILHEEVDNLYTVNPVVDKLVSYYERRGRFVHAGFLRDQIRQIARFAQELQRQLYNEEIPIQRLSDTVDDLNLLVREVREAGTDHYMACMRQFGDMKRTCENKSLEQRLEELETVQRRYINPLRELIDPGADYGRKIASLKRNISDLEARSELLSVSHELDISCRKIRLDLQFIDHVLLRNFGIVANTAQTLLKSLIQERKIRDAVAACLDNPDVTWQYLEKKSLVATGSQTIQAPGADKIRDFFIDVILKKILPNPQPLKKPDVIRQNADRVVIQNTYLQNCISREKKILSWPAFVIRTFGSYPENEQLKAIAFPLINYMKGIIISKHNKPFIHQFKTYTIQMKDFGLTEASEHNEKSA